MRENSFSALISSSESGFFLFISNEKESFDADSYTLHLYSSRLRYNSLLPRCLLPQLLTFLSKFRKKNILSVENSMKVALVIIKTKGDLISVTLSLIVKNAKGKSKRKEWGESSRGKEGKMRMKLRSLLLTSLSTAKTQ